MCVLAVITWIVLLMVLFSDQIDRQRNPNQHVEGVLTGDGTAEIVLHRNRRGHYVATGSINGVDAEFMLDTGATAVAISTDVAQRSGLERGPAIAVATANGYTTAYATRVDTLRLGTIVEHDVPATILPNLEGSQALLGMSFLKRLDFSQSGATLVLKSRQASDVAHVE